MTRAQMTNKLLKDYYEELKAYSDAELAAHYNTIRAMKKQQKWPDEIVIQQPKE